jgi:acyl carrier protein
VDLNIVNQPEGCNAPRECLTVPMNSVFTKMQIQYMYSSNDPREGSMDKIEIEEKVIEILSRHTAADRSAITPEKNLKMDLGLDSLDVAEIVYELETAFGISISDQSAEQILRISDTVSFISEKLEAVASADNPMESKRV